ncbi:uncharacterized protein LACBIDRAFT_314571 [Laccaria bicolor S238N-H82]|uniref:guanosine-diphosphatase n=1 Tax=Laccaria bicolor (strain S238N-H82 / ATCC MYA-4686) TaxID=486041 RepID=B0DYT8_LACBS|nr:uncharacterized protein LACBIDRAFT_314571 [Laccaria bicolor S238N-H82]EDR00195.1 predicted protein [Laccaria bicolor S238N-H82]|eukprot:XP_001889104.1 predicted protein [Laccaria bicolor S238N-H82]
MTHCSHPHSLSSNSCTLVRYALMIDAGPTGSRIHVYIINNCGPSPEYELRALLCTGTPVAVKATAVLRLLRGSQSADILEAVEGRIRSSYPFQTQEKDGVVIMDFKDEGVYAWITANYLLGTINGASTQIVFEPVLASSDMQLEDGEHKYDLQFGGRNHVLYQHSYLGSGLMRARRHVHRLADFMSMLQGTKPKAVVGNPCLARGTRMVVTVKDEVTGVERKVTMDGGDIGSFEACDRVVQLVLAKDADVSWRFARGPKKHQVRRVDDSFVRRQILPKP